MSNTGSVPFPIQSIPQPTHGQTPALPPQMESVRSHTTDDIARMIKRTPLFMTSLEDAEGGEDGM